MALSKDELARVEQEGHNAAQEGEKRIDNPYDKGEPVDTVDSVLSEFFGSTAAQQRQDAWDRGYDKFEK